MWFPSHDDIDAGSRLVISGATQKKNTHFRKRKESQQMNQKHDCNERKISRRRRSPAHKNFFDQKKNDNLKITNESCSAIFIFVIKIPFPALREAKQQSLPNNLYNVPIQFSEPTCGPCCRDLGRGRRFHVVFGGIFQFCDKWGVQVPTEPQNNTSRRSAASISWPLSVVTTDSRRGLPPDRAKQF